MSEIYQPLEHLKKNATFWSSFYRDWQGWHVNGQYTEEVYLKLAETRKVKTEQGIWYFKRWTKVTCHNEMIDRLYFSFSDNGKRPFDMGYLEVTDGGWDADQDGNKAGIFIKYNASAEYIAHDLADIFVSFGMSQ